MRDFPAYRRSAVRYWERRRIVYNAALILPALLGYGMADTMNWVGDAHSTDYSTVLPAFFVAAIGANVCYTFCYAMEFAFGDDDPNAPWLKSNRSTAFVCGVLFSLLLAFAGGCNIASLAWNFRHR